MSGITPVGLSIVDSANKGTPRLLYQDTGKGSTPQGSQVYAATLGGRDYAFLATNQGQTGIFLYDMTASRSLNKCEENTNTAPGACTGVFRGRIGNGASAVYLDGVGTATGKHYLAVSSGGFSVSDKGVELWNVTNPLAPTNVHSSSGRFLTGQISHGVAVWEQGSQQFLAVHVDGGAQIYNITSCLAGGCSSLGSPIWTGNWSAFGQSPLGADRLYVTFSRSNSRPFLYFGSNDQCSGGKQREFLFDVTTASSPSEITPDGIASIAGQSIDYWAWYYSGNNPATGFSRVMPMAAKFSGSVLYRVAQTIFDTHVWTNAAPTPPVANFTWVPTSGIYPGTPVTFTDTSTGNVTSRQWTFPADATVLPNTTSTPVTAIFTTPGTKAVTLEVENAVGSNTRQQDVTVLDPAPAIGSVTHNPPSPLTCQAVTFTANTVTGNPAPAVSWIIRDQNGQQVFPLLGEQPGNPIVLPALTLAGAPGGQPYTAIARATNIAGTTTAPPHAFTITSPPALSFTGPGGAPICTNCTSGSPPFGNVNLNASATGATDYAWDFGDGNFRGYTTGETQYNVAQPSFSYSSTGQKAIRAKIKGCSGELTSATLTVTISQVDPLTIETFEAVCPFAPCGFNVGQSITFLVDHSGSPTAFHYDWNGDGTFEDTTTTGAPVGGVVTHTYNQASPPTGYRPVLKILRGSETAESQHGPIVVSSGGGGGGPNPSLTITGPSSGQPNVPLAFSAAASNCTPSATWNWNGGGGTVSGTGSSVTITWASTGSKTVSVTNSGCSGASGSKAVSISDAGNPGGGGLVGNFTFSPTAPEVGEAVAFNGGVSTGGPSAWTWTFGDGAMGSGQQVSHTYQAAGVYSVRLEIGKLGDGPGCSLGFCSASVTKSVTVTGGLQVSFTPTAGAECVSDFGINQCTAQAGVAVQLTASAPGATTLSWEFGDGGTGTGIQVSHVWNQPGSYVVKLTAGDGTALVSASRTFVVIGDPPPPPAPKTIVLPWIAQTRGALLQSSDLYVHNPGTSAMDVTLEFRKRGVPEANPPRVPRTIQPGATLYVADALRELFNRENVAGFISVTVDEGDVTPVITSFNTTFQADGKQFGQTVAGVPMGAAGSAAPSHAGNQVEHLVGLIDNSERLAYFGISNPSDEPALYHLRFFDKEGRQIGESDGDLALSRFGQRQFQVRDIHDLFGISNAADYRVEIENKTGAHVIPYASNLRLSSEDPSFIKPASSASAKVYLIGVLSQPGLNNSLWQTDALLTNISTQAIAADVTFTNVGLNGTTTSPLRVTLAPGTTERLENVVAGQWGIDNAIGVLTITSTSASGPFPVVQGESYDNTNPAKRFGQSMTAVSDADAAEAGEAQFLVGLRQDAENRTTVWILNPADEASEYDLIYRRLDGTPIGNPVSVRLGAGKMRQFGQFQHPLPGGIVQDGFTLQIKVRSGKVLSAAQVINNLTNDPAYIQGEVR